MNRITVSILSTAFIFLLVGCHKEQTVLSVQEASPNSTIIQTKCLGDKEPMFCMFSVLQHPRAGSRFISASSSQRQLLPLREESGGPDSGGLQNPEPT